MNRHEDPGQNMIRHIFGEKFQLNTCLQDDFCHDNVAELFIFIIYIIKLLTLLDVSKEFLKTKIASQSSRH